MAEMSGRFFASGPRMGEELTLTEYEKSQLAARIERVERRLDHCSKSLFWLGHALNLPISFDLAGMIRKCSIEGSADLYHDPEVIQKAASGVRIIISPKPELMLVQKRIHRLLLETFKRPPGVFGYRGGTCYEVAERHAGWASTLKFDVKDAFFQVYWTKVRRALRGSRYVPNTPGFSNSIAYWIAKLCTYAPPHWAVQVMFPTVRSFLPQGAPTSPICFDLTCTKLDAKLARIAERVGGIVSRYADNYYFSMPTSRISAKLEGIIVCEAEDHGFPIHKVRKVGQGELCRILGYNVRDGRITNKRDFNRNFRGALYVLKTKLERGLDWRDAYARVRGYMGLAVNLPADLAQTYQHCEALVRDRS